jgi:hypothetical protein
MKCLGGSQVKMLQYRFVLHLKNLESLELKFNFLIHYDGLRQLRIIN